MKKYISLILITLFLFSGQIVFAQGENQTPTEKAIQGVKETVGALIDAKDKNDPKEPEFKIETYKKVLDLSLQDAKDVKIKLLTYDASDNSTGTIALWQKDRLIDLNNAIKHYEKEQVTVNNENISGEDVKTLAENLTKWRNESYSPLTEEIQGFLLIEQQKKSMDTTEKRLEKVRLDVLKLKKAKFKNIKTIEEKFKKSENLIKNAEDQLGNAEKLFMKKYLLEYMDDTNPTKIAIIKEIKEEEKTQKEKKVVPTDVSATPTPTPSIKDLIDDSFAKVKESYQIFIEMSGLVKK